LFHSFLTSALDRDGQIHAPAAFPFSHGPRYPLNRGWIGSRVGLEASERGRIIYATANLGDPSRSLAALTAVLSHVGHSCLVACIS
jgi:hypothetical protein